MSTELRALCFDCGSELHGPYCPSCNPHISQDHTTDAALRTIATLRRELAEAVKALEPFAAAAESEWAKAVLHDENPDGMVMKMTRSHLRAAQRYEGK